MYIFEDGQLDSINVVTCSINKGDSIPINQPPRHIPFAPHKKVKQVVDDDTEESSKVQSSLLPKRMEKQDYV